MDTVVVVDVAVWLAVCSDVDMLCSVETVVGSSLLAVIVKEVPVPPDEVDVETVPL